MEEQTKKIGIILFTIIQITCIFVAVIFASDTNEWYDPCGAVLYAILAILCEIVKYKINHNDNNDENTKES